MAKLNLKQAIEQNKLADFIKQNKGLTGNQEQFDETMNKMINNSKPVRQTSSEGSSEN